MDNPFISPRILSIGPGFLGLERGLQRAIGEIQVICHVEVETFIMANLLAGMQAGVVGEAPLWIDVKTFYKVAKHFRKKIHGILAGYPCQPFSQAGKRKGLKDPRHIYPYISDTISTTGPVFCFFENVSGHLSMGFDVVYKDLRSMGYAVEAGIYTAEEVGAPHERERLFILAISEKFLANCKSDEFYNAISARGRVGRFTNIGTSKLVDTSSESGRKTSQGGLDLERNTLHKTGRHQSTDRPQSPSQAELAHSTGAGLPQLRYDGKPVKSKYNGTSNNGAAELGHANPAGCQQYGRAIAVCPQFTTPEYASDRWPARPGQEQYDWESPRTVKPGLGVRINGYNFREDLLRAAGNSVVEQTAEIAFLDLLQKHLKNIR